MCSLIQTFTLLGIHSTKFAAFLFCTASICSSTSFIDILPRNIVATRSRIMRKRRSDCLSKSTCKVPAMPRVTGSHHVLGIKHLQSQFWDSDSTVLLGISTVQKYYRDDRCGVTDLATRGANPGMKKCSLGKGTMLTASFLRSALSWPGNLRQVVTPDIVMGTKWFKSP
jgi:hypothetical protein